MNVFRLVLFLAGLAAYLVAKQWFQPSGTLSSPAKSSPSAVPAPEARHVVSSQASPKAEIVKSERGIVEVRR